jgi:sensor histidine kinase regulating citrate/malate metabolism
VTFRLRTKILLIAVGVTVVGMAIVFSASSHLISRSYVAALQSRSVAIGQSLTLQLDRIQSLGIGLENLAGFEKQCREVVETYDGIEFAAIAGRDGTILFHSDPSRHGGRLTEEAILKVLGSESTVAVAYTAGDSYGAVVPIRGSEGAVLGGAVVAVSPGAVADRLREVQYGRFAIGLRGADHRRTSGRRHRVAIRHLAIAHPDRLHGADTRKLRGPQPARYVAIRR